MMDRTQPLILVVDDEPHIVHVVSLKLSHAGYDVLSAEDGQEALEIALRHRPDLILTDLQMPYMNGIEFVEALREHHDHRDTPVIMLTARGFGLTQDQLTRLKIGDVISKPFSPRELLERVQVRLNQFPGALHAQAQT